MRTRLSEIVHSPKRGDRVSRLYDFFIVIVAILSIAPALFHANSLGFKAQNIISTIDIISVYILSFDYLLRWMTYDIEVGKRGQWKEFLKFPFTVSAIIDLLSILPTLNVLPSGFLFLRALRIVRLFRYSKQLAVIVNVFLNEKKTLGSVFLLALAYIFATALIMFTFEPSTFRNFMDAVYWATITLTTIGFGDIHPNSDLGQVITSISSIIGIFIFALPAGIMTGSFLRQTRLEAGEDQPGFTDNFFGNVKPSLSQISPKKIKEYFKTHPRVVLYIRFIFVGVMLNALLYLLTSIFLGQVVWLDTTGTAFVACVLDPAAAVIVAFINNLFLAIYLNSPQSILYCTESCLVALTYAFLYKRAENGNLPLKNSFKMLSIIILGQSALSLILAFFLSGGTFTSGYENAFRLFLDEWGINYYFASVVAIICNRALDVFFVFGLVNLLVKFLNRKHFSVEAWVRAREEKAGICAAEPGGAAAGAGADGAAAGAGADMAETADTTPDLTQNMPHISRWGSPCAHEASVVQKAGKRKRASSYTAHTTHSVRATRLAQSPRTSYASRDAQSSHATRDAQPPQAPHATQTSHATQSADATHKKAGEE